MTAPDLSSDPTELVGSEFVFGTTIEDARSLIPLASLTDDEDAPPMGGLGIVSAQVASWIVSVASTVRATIAGFERITSETRRTYIANAARSVVSVGAAYWWEAARTQARRDHSGGSYAQDLEDRYKQMLADLAGMVSRWLSELPPDEEDGVVRARIGMSFPPPTFADGTRW